MLKPLTLLQTASALALALALPVAAQEAATDEAPAEEATAEGTDAAAEGAPTAEEAAPEGEASGETAEAAPAQDVDAATVVASVNGTDITLGEVAVAVRQLPAQYQQLPPDVLFAAIVDQIVQQELLAQTVTEEPGILGYALANQRRSILASEAASGVVEAAASEEALQAAYDAAYTNAEPMPEWNASHILVASEEEAQAVVARLEAGEEFAAVAQEVSTDTGSGAAGGELGWFGRGMMVPEFEEGVAGLEAGEVSAPIQSQFGWHVIRLNEVREQALPELEAVRAELEGQLQQEAIQARLAELEAAGEVTRPEPGQFDPAVLSDPALLGD